MMPGAARPSKVILAMALILGAAAISLVRAERAVRLLGPNDKPPSIEEEYVGDARCGECHAAIVAHWKTTAHAHAFQTLVKAGRSSSAECVRCHSTAFGLPGGMDPVRLTPESRRNVQCESCHGPAAKHLREMDTGALHTYGCVRCEAGRVCFDCHTVSQDPKFSFKESWSRLAHPKQIPSPVSTP